MSDPDVKAYYSELRAGKTFEEIFGEERAAEIIAKQSENRTGKHVGFDPWNKGVPADPDHIARMIAAREGMDPWNKGVPMSDELRAKLEAAGFWEMTDEKRRHNSEAHLGQEPWNKGQTMDDDYCQTASEAAKARFDPDHQALMTERAREVNTGTARPQDVRDKISASNLTSEARKAYADSIRGIPRTEDVKQAVSEALQASEKAKEYHQGRIGKSRGNNPSGHYGVIWDKSRNKWQVRVQGKVYGRFARLEDAIAKVDEIMVDSTQADSL